MKKEMTNRGIGKDLERVGIPLAIVILLCIFFFKSFFSYPFENTILLRVLGIGIFAVGLFIHLKAANSMSKAFKDNRLLTDGAFKYCRNPMYATLFFMIIPGLSLIFNLWLIIVVTPILLIIFFLRIHEEDEYLEKQFGDDYINYRKKVALLIPKLW